jgi:hypothetical protein
MNDLETAQRLTAWTWAAETLGIEASQERLAGLVQVTRGVSHENLKSALEVVIQTEPRGFLPAPGAVIAAANRIAGIRRDKAMAELQASRREHARIAAVVAPASPEQVQEIRDRIALLAGSSSMHKSAWTEKIPKNDQKGLAAARAATGSRR